MKKVLSLVLALLMAASSASAVLADEAIADVEETAVVEEVAEAGQYDKAISFLANYGIFKGISADDLGADLDVNRYQMALFVGRISTGWVDDSKWEDGPENWSEFTDISEGAVADYWGALSYANQKGIIEGYGNGKFGPYDGITYQNALTMVVRTLGYTGLDWPWGYIQKAVELGLTDGITDVAYTEELTRGETAQIIYNALFAKTKAGTTLAMSSFGIEFGWEKVIITASDLDIFTKDGKDAYKEIAKKENGYAYTQWEKSNKTDVGYVAFQILNDDGTLGDDVYYMAGTDIGLSAAAEAHDDEAVVGDAYYILFEKDEDSNLCEVVAYESLHTETIWNLGKTDDDGDAQDYAIQEYLENYKLVSKYTGNSYVNVTSSGKDELLVYSATGTITESVVDGNYLAIDWLTGDILGVVYDDKNGNGRIEESEIDVDEDGNYNYEVLWYYNELLDKYYEIKYTGDYDDDDDLGDKDVWAVNYMSDAEFEKTYKEFIKYAYENHNAYTVLTKIKPSAYASLELFDTNLDGVADRGIYEEYRLGKFYENTSYAGGTYCDCNGWLKSYRIDNVGSFSKAVDSAKTYTESLKNADVEDISYSNINVLMEGRTVCCDCKDAYCSASHARGWFAEGYTPVATYDEDGEFTGYAEGYVIYSYDSETGEIKVVKNVNDGTDADSYVATGVLRAYNLKNGTVTIGEEKFDIADYDELAGNAFRYVTKSSATRAHYTDLFRNLFNQFVEYVVVDGEVVTVRAKSASGDKLIVVDSYAGLSSDGYIVVNGYDTTNLKYTQFRIGSYDGWQKGDYYYYLDEATADESFKKGAIYTIASYDAEEEVYYVRLAGEFTDRAFKNYVVADDAAVDGSMTTKINIKADTDGYFTWTATAADGTVTTKNLKMKDGDKYVIIETAVEGRPYATVTVYQGKLAAGWEVEGNVINTGSYDKRTYVFVNADIKVGFNDTHKSGLVLLLNDAYTVADYNGTDAEDWYLLGASVYELEAMNLFNGDMDAVYAASNKNLKEGHVYFTQDGVVVEDLGCLTMADIIKAATEAYANPDDETGSYWFGYGKITDTTLWNGDKDADEKFIYNNSIGYNSKFGTISLSDFTGTNNFYDDIIDNDITIYGVEYKNNVIKDVENLSKKEFEKIVEDYDTYSYNVYYVYSVETKDVVAYIDLVEGDTTKVLDAADDNDVIVAKYLGQDGEVNAQIVANIVSEDVIDENGDVIAQNILGVKFAYELADEDARHALIAKNGWFFGLEGKDTFEAYDVVYNIWTSNPSDTSVNGADVLKSVVVAEYTEYENHDADCEDCKLVQSIYVEFEEPVTTAIYSYNADGEITNAQNFAVRVAIGDQDDIDQNNLFNVKIQNGLSADKTEIAYRLIEATVKTVAGDPVVIVK